MKGGSKEVTKAKMVSENVEWMIEKELTDGRIDVKIRLSKQRWNNEWMA